MTAFRYRLTFVVVFLLLLGTTAAQPMLAQTPAPERFVTPVRTDLPGRTVWAFATTGTGTNITTFAATDKGLFRSTGTSWTEVPTLKNQEVYAVKSRRVGNTSTLLIGTKKGVLRSVDGGTTWNSPEVTTGTVISTSNILELKKVFDIEIVNSTWFAATDKGVFRSTSDGRSWTLLNIDRSVDNNEVRGITAEGSTIVVNLWREGLWRSTNTGGSWAKLAIPGETALIRAVHAQQGTSATIWLAGSVAGNLWRSVNGGSSWTRVYQTASTARTSTASGVQQSGIDAITGYVTPIHGKSYIAMFAAHPQGIASSLDEGKTWNTVGTETSKAVSLVAYANSLYVGTESEPSAVGFSKDGTTSVQSMPGSAQQYSVNDTVDCTGIIAIAATIKTISPSILTGGVPGRILIEGCNLYRLKSIVFWKNHQIVDERYLSTIQKL